MKIGKFAEYNGLTFETIRHYIDMGLILPVKKDGQYDLDDTCQKDIEDIITFKGMGFSLIEIKSIFMFKRLSNLTKYQEEDVLLEIFNNKVKQLICSITKLTQMKANLINYQNFLSSTRVLQSTIIGVDYRILDLLKCIVCNGSLELSEGSIRNNQIINGKLYCACGHKYIIKDGILIICEDNNLQTGFDFNYIADYLTNTNIDYFETSKRGMDWIHKKIDFTEMEHKVILELGSGIGFFLRSIYDELPDSCVYIAVDHDIKRLLFLKKILDSLPNKKNILFICTDFLKLPLKDQTLDAVFDICGTSNYCINHEELLLSKIDCIIKNQALFASTFILCRNIANNSILNKDYETTFLLKFVKNEIMNLSYQIIEEKYSMVFNNNKIYDVHALPDEKVFAHHIIARKLG